MYVINMSSVYNFRVYHINQTYQYYALGYEAYRCINQRTLDRTGDIMTYDSLCRTHL